MTENTELREQVGKALHNLGLCHLNMDGDTFKVLNVDMKEQWPVEYVLQVKDDHFVISARLLRIPAVKGEEERSEMLQKLNRLNERGLWGECFLDEEGRVWIRNKSDQGSLTVKDEVKAQISAGRMLLMLYARILCPEMDKERGGYWEHPLGPLGKIRKYYRLKPAYSFIPFWRGKD